MCVRVGVCVTHRPAWSIALDDDTVALAVPAWVANNKPTADVTSHLYFMTVEVRSEFCEGHMPLPFLRCLHGSWSAFASKINKQGDT